MVSMFDILSKHALGKAQYVQQGILTAINQQTVNNSMTEYNFYVDLANKVSAVTPEQIIKNDPKSYGSTPRIEVDLYVEIAKEIALCTLGLLLQGALLATDEQLINPKLYKDKGALKHAAQSFVDEANALYVENEEAPLLKFDEVSQGVDHLEQIIAKM